MIMLCVAVESPMLPPFPKYGSTSGSVPNQRKIQLVNIVFINCTSSNGSTILATDSDIRLDSVTIKNSTSDFGAIYLIRSKLSLVNSTLSSNSAHADGGAVLATDESEIIIDSQSTFINNKKYIKINNLIQSQWNDISLWALSSASIDLELKQVNISSNCDDTSKFLDYNKDSICKVVAPQTSRLNNSSQCNDTICNAATEDYFNCPSDCPTTHFNGFLHTQYECASSISSSGGGGGFFSANSKSTIGNGGNLKGELETYLRTKENGKLFLRITSSNLNLRVLIDKTQIIEYQSPLCPFKPYDMFHNYESNQLEEQQKTFIAYKYLVADSVHNLIIQYSPSSKHYSGERMLSIEYSSHAPTKFKPLEKINFYSFNTQQSKSMDHVEMASVTKAIPTNVF
eukprot:gene3855-4455_t